jgi:hypothetical protein
MSVIGLLKRSLDDLLDPASGPSHQVGKSSAWLTEPTAL